MEERERAITLANKLLEQPNCDPDDDLRVLARQFLREIERRAKDAESAIDARNDEWSAGYDAGREAAAEY